MWPISWIALPALQPLPRVTVCCPPCLPTERRASAPGHELDAVGVLRLRWPGSAGTKREVRVRLPVRDRVGDPSLVRQARVDVIRDRAVGPTELGSADHHRRRDRFAGELCSTHLGLLLDALDRAEVDVALDDRHPVDRDVLDRLRAEREPVDERCTDVVPVPCLALRLRLARPARTLGGTLLGHHGLLVFDRRVPAPPKPGGTAESRLSPCRNESTGAGRMLWAPPAGRAAACDADGFWLS